MKRPRRAQWYITPDQAQALAIRSQQIAHTLAQYRSPQGAREWRDWADKAHTWLIVEWGQQQAGFPADYDPSRGDVLEIVVGAKAQQEVHEEQTLVMAR